MKKNGRVVRGYQKVLSSAVRYSSRPTAAPRRTLIQAAADNRSLDDCIK